MPRRPFEDEDSIRVLHRAQDGDCQALDELMHRYLPRVRRWAAGRLPAYARSLVDTDDIVQETLAGTVRNIDTLEPRHDASIEMYLRRAVANRLKDELRRARRTPPHGGTEESLPDPAPSPLEQAISQQALSQYQQALAQVSAMDREAIVARLELGYSHREVAELLGKPTPDAARVAVERAILRLGALMRDA